MRGKLRALDRRQRGAGKEKLSRKGRSVFLQAGYTEKKGGARKIIDD